MKFKKQIIFLTVIIIVVISGILIQSKQPKIECLGLNPKDEASIKCFGVISIGSFNDYYRYTIYDHTKNYAIAEIRGYSDFILKNNKIYVTDQAQNFDYNNLTQEYSVSYLVDNKMQKFTAKSKDLLPKYFIIDTMTGNVEFYIQENQIPNSEKELFNH